MLFRSTDQYVILGAGLDTFAHRNAYAGLTVYEVDHAASQRSKLACLHDAGIVIPRSARHVTIDFETGDLLGALAAAGFDRCRPAVFAMLGVVFYVWRSLRYHHAVWHVFVLLGSVLQFLSVLWYVLPKAA